VSVYCLFRNMKASVTRGKTPWFSLLCVSYGWNSYSVKCMCSYTWQAIEERRKSKHATRVENKLSVQDLGLSQWCWWRFRFSAVWCCVDWFFTCRHFGGVCCLRLLGPRRVILLPCSSKLPWHIG
jgi:hypothetical protein